MEQINVVDAVIWGVIGLNVLISYKGFQDYYFREKYLFHVGSIIGRKDYLRMVSSGFLHADWMHLGFNMFTFHSFAKVIIVILGPVHALGIYFVSLLLGNLLSLYVHRNHAEYRALGASGAVSGMVFASILLFPEGEIGLYGAFFIPSWIYAVFYTAYSIYGIKSQSDNIGHEAHLGGAMAGVFSVLGLYFIAPDMFLFEMKWWLVAVMVVPTAIFLYLLVNHPDVVNVGGKGGQGSWAEWRRLQTKASIEGKESLSLVERLKLGWLNKKYGD